MTKIPRREFLASAALSAGAFLALPRATLDAGTSSASALPSPCASNAWTKHGVVLGSEPDGPVQNFTCPAEPIEHGCWRLWFSASRAPRSFTIGFAEGKPGEPMTRHLAVLSSGEPADAPFSVGNLPEGWRPVQVVHLHLKNGRHRIYFWAHGPKVVRYLAAESDDGRRYRVLDPLRPCLYHPQDRAVDAKAVAAVGLARWAKIKGSSQAQNEPAAPAGLLSNDATNVYQVDDGTFEMYSVGLVEVERGQPGYVAHDNAAGWVRVIDRYVSQDGLHWTDRRRVIVPDARDPGDQQFYYLAVTHTPQGRMGMLGHYRVEAQTMDLEWCYSADGIAWQRPSRQAWIPRGKPGELDCYGIYASHGMIRRDGLWHLFYTGVNAAHNAKHSFGPPTQSIMYATCPQPWS